MHKSGFEGIGGVTNGTMLSFIVSQSSKVSKEGAAYVIVYVGLVVACQCRFAGNICLRAARLQIAEDPQAAEQEEEEADDEEPLEACAQHIVSFPCRH